MVIQLFGNQKKMFALRVLFSVVLLHHYCCAFLPITEPVDYSSTTELHDWVIIKEIPANVKKAVVDSMPKGYFIADQLSALQQVGIVGSELYKLSLVMDNSELHAQQCEFRVRVEAYPHAVPFIEKKKCFDINPDQ